MITTSALRAKLAWCQVAKRCGLFAVARRLTAGALRILCYHGISLGDEHEFRPALFMRADTFEGRLKRLVDGGYPILPLGEAIARLRAGTLPRNATVITIDDGFYGNFRYGMAIIQQYGLPATMYVTTYYVDKGTPVFRLAVQYMFWKTTRSEIDLGQLEVPGLDTGRLGRIDLRDHAVSRKALRTVVYHLEERCSESERVRFCHLLGGFLNVDYASIAERRGLSLVTQQEMRAMKSAGIDLQLHTHRHRLPVEREQVQREIEDNRAVLGRATASPRVHFCYPSGEWDSKHFAWLQECGIESATTCDLGFNYPDTPTLALRRFQDAEDYPALLFEAEMSGFLELARRARPYLRSPFRSPPSQ